MDYNFDSVNFTEVNPIKTIVDEYDTTTTEKYRIMRLYKVDPIMNEEIPNHLIFEFKYKWNPITGKRETLDDYGALCFNALNLYQFFFSNRFNGLWYPPVDQFQGYYGDLVGSSKDILINGRPCPEKYLYRLPIIDCYLKKTHNYSIITMGPILTDEEINQIDIILSNYRKNKPTLKLLKEYYDQAINNSPDISELKLLNPTLSERELNEKYNKMYVDKLINFSKI
jgi:hypothetical protein